MKLLLSYLKDNLCSVILEITFAVIYLSIFWLCGLPLVAVIYPTLLCLAAYITVNIFAFLNYKKKHNTFMLLKKLPDEICERLSSYNSLHDRDYRDILFLISQREMLEKSASDRKMTEMIDYYTTWVHQIKVPIASMRLTLQSEDSEYSRKLADDLFKIEQYVEMVLTYLRLDSEFTDYVFKKYSVDDIVKGSIRKFAGQFIGRGVTLEYSGCNKTVMTDEKWLSFVIEQILSNALKYAAEGKISVYFTEPFYLCIEDNGIGIAGEDLPRIFDKGFTGFNGRTDMRASGLGLYLCKRICGILGHDISVSSELGKGTTVMLDLSKKNVSFE